MGTRAGGRADISGSTTSVIVGYVHGIGGEAAVEELLHLAAETRTSSELRDPSGWSTYEQVTALFEAAVILTGDPEVGRRIGEMLLRQHAGTEVAALLRSLGSPGEVLRNVAATAAKYSTVTRMTALEVSDGEAVVEARTVAPIVRHPLFCEYTKGVLSQAPPLFGLDEAAVEEVECQTQGDERCLYRVRWVDHADADREVDYLRHQLALLTGRVESLQATATELMSATSVDEVLEAVTVRAGRAVRAPRFVLAVRLDDAEDLRVHSVGFESPEEAKHMAATVFEQAGRTSALVVPVATTRRSFGMLAALYPRGYRFFPQEREILSAYAGYAAAALEVASALDEARRQNETARALLDLAHSLAQVSTREELATRLVAAGRQVASGDVAAVLLWDDDADGLRLVAQEGMNDDAAAALLGIAIRPSDTPLVATLRDEPAPLIVDSGEADPFVAGLCAVAGVEQGAVVPIVSGRELLGLVAVGFRTPRSLTADLFERLSGIAASAATYAVNVRLLEQVSFQATHDSLTGLYNTRGFGQRAELALAELSGSSSPVAMLFVDLDSFKPVNDAFGHEVGDRVLREVAERLKAATRANDVIARLGGDEFVVILPSVTDDADAAAAAARVGLAISGSYSVGGVSVTLAASVGVAIVDDAAGIDLRELMRKADAAMYAVKLARRGR